MECRAGIGYDVHRLAAGESLWLGGLKITHPMGTIAHSDGDVLIHAICDALFGAARLGDIGSNFPDNSPEFKNIDSKILLAETCRILRNHHFEIVNIDTTVCAQQPKLRPYIPEMEKILAGVMQIGETQVSVKATTTEGLGFTGREEGISAFAVAMIRNNRL